MGVLLVGSSRRPAGRIAKADRLGSDAGGGAGILVAVLASLWFAAASLDHRLSAQAARRVAAEISTPKSTSNRAMNSENWLQRSIA